jgi:ATP-dependent Zn protease
MDEERTAFHEAGHAVAAHVLRRKIEFVTIAKGEGRAGLARLSDIRPNQWTRRERDIVVAFAGPFAEIRKYGQAKAAGVDDDLQYIRSEIDLVARARNPIASAEDVERLRTELSQRGQALVDSHWTEIEAVAFALLKYETLSGAVVKRLLR